MERISSCIILARVNNTPIERKNPINGFQLVLFHPYSSGVIYVLLLITAGFPAENPFCLANSKKNTNLDFLESFRGISHKNSYLLGGAAIYNLIRFCMTCTADLVAVPLTSFLLLPSSAPHLAVIFRQENVPKTCG